jgi:hypothetical protein
MASHKERFADKMEFPPETPQPNIYPLSWNSKTKKLQEVWEAALRENWDGELHWEERESIAYWWTLLSVFDASAPPVFAEALIKTYEVHEEDPVRRVLLLRHPGRAEPRAHVRPGHHQAARHPDPLTYEPKTELGRGACRRTPSGCTSTAAATGGLQDGRAEVPARRALLVSFLMGEIAAATIFHQMAEGCPRAGVPGGFRNIGRDEGRHMAICMPLMERDYPKLDVSERRSSPSRSAPATCSCRPCCSSRRWTSGTCPPTSSTTSARRGIAREAGFHIPDVRRQEAELAQRDPQPEGRARPLRHPVPGDPRGGGHRRGGQRRRPRRHHPRLLRPLQVAPTRPCPAENDPNLTGIFNVPHHHATLGQVGGLRLWRHRTDGPREGRLRPAQQLPCRRLRRMQGQGHLRSVRPGHGARHGLVPAKSGARAMA